jgi:hypothetical protein
MMIRGTRFAGVVLVTVSDGVVLALELVRRSALRTHLVE